MPFDDADMKILRELAVDGRMPWVELANKVGLSAPACQRRVQALTEARVIEKIAARVNPLEMGYAVEGFVSVSIDHKDVAKAKRFRKSIQGFPEVQDCHKMAGDVDYLLRVVAPDLQTFGRFVEDRILTLPGVTDTRSSIALERIKTS